MLRRKWISEGRWTGDNQLMYTFFTIQLLKLGPMASKSGNTGSTLRTLSVETVSQLSRRRAIYTSNSLVMAYTIAPIVRGYPTFRVYFCGCYSSQNWHSKLISVGQSAAIAILQHGDETEMFISINKNRVLWLLRIALWNGRVHRYSCPSFSPAKRCCFHHFIYAPFSYSDENWLRMNSNKEKRGEVSVDKIRQLCAATAKGDSPQMVKL